MYCNKCGRELPSDTMFCSACGKKLKDINKQRISGMTIYHIIMCSIYGIALLTCFICNLAVEHTLSWFYIVLISILMSFSITNLPHLVRKFQLISSAFAVTVLTYLLLLTCNIYSGGDWFWQYAFPIATVPIIMIWVILLTFSIKPLNWFFKSAIASFVGGILTMTTNLWVDYIIDGRVHELSYYFNLDFASGSGYNMIVAFMFFAYFLIGILIGVAYEIGTRRRTR